MTKPSSLARKADRQLNFLEVQSDNNNIISFSYHRIASQKYVVI